MLKKIVILFFVLCLSCVLILPMASARSLSPLDTQDANVIEAGSLEARIGLEYSEDLNLAFSTDTDRDRDVWNVPTLDLSVGVGKVVEIQAYFEGVHVDEKDFDSKYGAGDLELFTKVQLREEDDMPAFGLRFGTKLPNASNEDQLGTDEFDFSGGLLMSKHLGKVETHFNLGMGILGNPYQNSNQDDVLMYGVGVIIPATDRLNFALEVNGQGCSDDNNDFSHFMAGLQYQTEVCRFDVGAAAGLSDESQDWSVKCGITKTFDNFFAGAK